MKTDFPRWLILFAAISFAFFGAIRADATGISADLDPADGDQGLGSAEVPPGESVKIQLFAHGTENLTGFVAQIEFDPGAVDGASTAIGFSPGPATPVTFPVTVRRTVATGMGGQLPPNPVSEDMLLLGTFTFNTHPNYKGGGFRILKVEVKHGRDPSEAIEPGIELHIGPPGGGEEDDHGSEGDDGHEGDRGPGEGRGPSPEQLARMFDRWMKSDRAEDLNDDGEINGQDFKIFMDKMREEHEGDRGPDGDDGHEGDRGPGPGEGRGPSPEQLARMFDRWMKSDRAEDLNDDGEINGQDFKIFMDRMREEHEGDHGPEGDDGHEGDQGPGPGNGGPGDQGQHGPPPGEPDRVFERIMEMYPDPDKMPEGLGEALKVAETARNAVLEARKEALKAGIAFLESFLPHAKDPELAERVEEAIHHLKERLERVLERLREHHD